MTSLATKIGKLHDSLAAAGIAHAFGGALALAWCTQQARGTIDIDVNIFMSIEHLDQVIAALPRQVRTSPDARADLERDGQARFWWDTTPVDVFLNTTPFHERAALRCRTERFARRDIAFLSCTDLAVFKAFFNRSKDWADLEAMAEAGSLDADQLVGTLTLLLGVDDDRVGRAIALFRPTV